MAEFDLLRHNAAAWDREALTNSPWSQPVASDVVAAAREGHWQVHLTPSPPPTDWLGDIAGQDILCLAGAGGQQAPVLAAAGGHVTVFDLSTEQLARDAMVADRDGLTLTIKQGDMRDLSCFDDGAFDLILHPISNQYVPDIQPVWSECHRVLRTPGTLLTSFYNPVVFVADRDPRFAEHGLIRPRFAVPYSDLRDLDDAGIATKSSNGEALIFGHSLTSQIGGQLEAGFALTGFFEEMHPNPRFEIEKFLPSFIATRSVKIA